MAAIFEAEAEASGRGPSGGGERVRVLRDRLAVGGRLVDLWTPLGQFSEVHLPLHGAHQADNAAAAVAAPRPFSARPSIRRCCARPSPRSGSQAASRWCGRHPLVVLDGAHNPAGAAGPGGRSTEDFAAARRVIVVMGCLRGRDPDSCSRRSGPSVSTWSSPAARPRRGPRSPKVVAEAARALGLVAEVSETIAEALERPSSSPSRDDLVLVTGSLYVVGAARTALR